MQKMSKLNSDSQREWRERGKETDRQTDRERKIETKRDRDKDRESLLDSDTLTTTFCESTTNCGVPGLYNQSNFWIQVFLINPR